MSYCTVDDLRRILPASVTIGDRNLGTPSPGISGPKRSNISPAEAEYYIGYAQEYIDARLRPFYSCPLRRIKTFEGELYADVSHGSDVSITVRFSGPFNKGESVRLQDKEKMEIVIVKEVTDTTIFVAETVVYDYSATNSLVSIIEYPDPIRIVTARMACSIVLDRLFSAEQSPDVSQYGKTQRNLARNAIDDILAGEVLLFGQEHTGRRFVRGHVFDAYSSPAEIQRGEERE